MQAKPGVKPIHASARSDEDAVVHVLTLAFSTDPMARWAFPDSHTFLSTFPSFVRAFGGRAFDHGSAYHADSFYGASLWLPPGVEPDQEVMLELVQKSVPEDRLPDFFGVLEQMGEYHPHEPHWYLPLIGVDPISQGRGLGRAMLEHALVACDRDGLPAYLESSNPRNVPLYERVGFEAIGTIQSGSSPRMTPMFRKPR